MLDLVESFRRATLGELCWVGSSGPTGLTVVPLVLDETICVALPFSRLDVVWEIRDRPVAFAITDRVRGGQTTVAGFGQARVDFDIQGEVFVDRLLEQEIVKYPPTRLRADSLMARRENWWWVARALVTLPEVDRAIPMVGRSRPDDALLVTDDGSGGTPGLRVVTAPAWPSGVGDRVELYPRDGGLLNGAGDRGYLFGYQHSPDLERYEQWYRAGRMDGEHLVVQSAAGIPTESLPPFGLWQRFRAHRAVARACREGIAAAENDQRPTS